MLFFFLSFFYGVSFLFRWVSFPLRLLFLLLVNPQKTLHAFALALGILGSGFDVGIRQPIWSFNAENHSKHLWIFLVNFFWWIFFGVVWATRREVWILCFIANGRGVASCVFFFCCSFFFFVSLAVQSFFFFIFFTVAYHPWFSFSPGSTHYWTSSSSHVAV